MSETVLNLYWKTVVNTIQDGIMIVDKRGSIVATNKALEKITGFSREELVGNKCLILNCCATTRAKKNSGDCWCNLFKTGKMDIEKCTILQRDGTPVYVLKNAALLRDADGCVIGAVESLTDITETIKKDSQIEEYRKELNSENNFHGMLGRSVHMQQLFDIITNAAQSDAPVFIYGESGSGKELVAKSIHATGRRKRKPFVKVNCSALTESMLESELFGHTKDAYTRVHKTRDGSFEMAHGGDIFLEEIDCLPLATQAKLLRVLEEKVIERVGDNKPIPVDVRIISATNRNLNELVKTGAFREDLYFRINVIPIQIAPLRKRVEDISLFAESFFQRIKLKSGKDITGISNDAMEVLLKYEWPGNVRELKSAFEYAFVTCHETIIQPKHLPQNILEGRIPLNKKNTNFSDPNESKKKELVKALEQANGNQSKAAKILGVSRVTIWNRMKRYNINFKRMMEGQ